MTQKKRGFLSTGHGPVLLSKSLEISSRSEQSQLTEKTKIVAKSTKSNDNGKITTAEIFGDMCSEMEAPMMNIK